MRTKLILALLWIVSLTAVGVMAQAKPPVFTPPPTGASRMPPTTQPEVLVGPDIGFRVSRYHGDVPVGELVVRKAGKWVAVEFDAHMKMVK